ncbi:hypothetical protein ACB092_12G035400 [Castanea dentata]
MVALLTLFTNPILSSPSSSSSSVTVLLHPPIPLTTVHFSLSSVSTFHPHEWFLKFSKASRNELKPLFPQLGLRPTKHISIHCSCINSPTNLHTDIGILFPFFRELGLEDKETELVLDKNPTLALTSLDSIRARIEPMQLKHLLTAADPRFLVGFDQKVKLLLDRGVPSEKIGYVLNHVKLAKAVCLRPIEEIDRTITFFSPYGGIDLIVRRPEILNYNLESQLIPRIGFLLDLSGGDKDATGNVVRRLPMILSYSVEHLEGHVEFLRSFAGLNNQQIFKIFLVFPSVVSASKERKLRPRIEFLKQCGLDSNDIFKFLIKAPLFLGLSFDNLNYKLVFLVKIGYKYRTRDMAMAMGSVTRTSCENLRKVIWLFLSYGLSYSDIVSMSTKHPQILQYNHSSLEEKMEYLIEDMGREVGELLAFPAFLGYKLDERIKVRYEAKKKITGEGMSINKLLTVSTKRFSTNKKEKKLLLAVENITCDEG